MPKIGKKYSQERNIEASVLISTFMCLWANYIFPRWVCLFCWRKYVDRSWEYINRSQTHECGNWGWGRAIPRKGIHKRNCRCSVAGAVQEILQVFWISTRINIHEKSAIFCVLVSSFLAAVVSKYNKSTALNSVYFPLWLFPSSYFFFFPFISGDFCRAIF